MALARTQTRPPAVPPLLGADKADTAAYCRALGQPYREDSGNYMWRFTRNKLRHDLMPRLARDYNPRVREALTRLSRAATEEVDYIEGELARHWPNITEERDDAVTFIVPALSALHPALQRHALRRAYATIAGDARSLGESHLEAVLSLLRSEPGGRTVNLPRGVRARKEGHALRIARHAEPPLFPELTGEHTICLPQAPGEVLETIIGGWMVSIKAAEPDQPNPDVKARPPRFSACLNRDALGAVATVRTSTPRRPVSAVGHDRNQKTARLLHRRQGVPRTAR